MKSIWCLALVAMVFLATGICAAEVPDMLGVWTGSWSGYDDGAGYSNLTENDSITLTIVEQEDRIFSGNITIQLDNETMDGKGFAGAIGLDSKTLYAAEFDGGYAFGTIISEDEMELIYLADGENGSVAIDRLYRMEE
ncbi:MAG: hypothetical protein M0Q43_02985 [Methanothrix sp.]|jgi:hypothetical protein|nr:hypothetical protein [Methanothrix sp.]